MSTNIATTSQSASLAFNFFDPVQFETIQRVAMVFANSMLVPDIYRVSEKNPKENAMANCIIALSLSQRMQVDPLMAMQNLAIIQGRPSWSSKFLIGTVNTCGRFDELEYEFNNLGKLGKITYVDYVWQSGKKVAVEKIFDGSNIDNIECKAISTAKGKNKPLIGAEVTIKMAVQEGWYTKAGSKWPTMTKQMLIYRAASFWTNAYAPELSMGMRTIEEQNDIVEDTEYLDVTDAAATKLQNEKSKRANSKVVNFTDSEPVPQQGTDNADDKQAATDPVLEDKKPDAIAQAGRELAEKEEAEKAAAASNQQPGNQPADGKLFPEQNNPNPPHAGGPAFS